MGVESLLKWIVPDVTVVRIDESGKSDFLSLHDYRAGKGLQVSSGYVENDYLRYPLQGGGVYHNSG